MKHFRDFYEFTKTEEFAQHFSVTVGSNLPELKLPENFTEEQAQSMANYMSQLSYNTAMAMLQAYHHWSGQE